MNFNLRAEKWVLILKFWKASNDVISDEVNFERKEKHKKLENNKNKQTGYKKKRRKGGEKQVSLVFALGWAVFKRSVARER